MTGQTTFPTLRFCAWQCMASFLGRNLELIPCPIYVSTSQNGLVVLYCFRYRGGNPVCGLVWLYVNFSAGNLSLTFISLILTYILVLHLGEGGVKLLLHMWTDIRKIRKIRKKIYQKIEKAKKKKKGWQGEMVCMHRDRLPKTEKRIIQHEPLQLLVCLVSTIPKS